MTTRRNFSTTQLDTRSVAERVALFRTRAREFLTHPYAGELGVMVLTVNGDGSMGGTRINREHLESLLLRCRLFDQRNDSAVALATMSGALRAELAGHPERVAELDTMRRQHRERRRDHLQVGVPVTVGTVATRQDLLELAAYGCVWHLDADKQPWYDRVVAAGAQILVHQAQLLSLQLLLSEVGDMVRFVDRCEAFGVVWSTS